MLRSLVGSQAEDGIRDAQESRGLGDVYKRQAQRRSRAGPRAGPWLPPGPLPTGTRACRGRGRWPPRRIALAWPGCALGATGLPSCPSSCLLYTSDAADEEDSVDLGGRRIIKK